MHFQGEEPPYLSVGTEVSAKYKGAFCEAKVRKVDRVVKCKVAFKQGFGSHTVLDNQIKGQLRVGAIVEGRHPEKKESVEGTITKIQDCSQYTVVFDDGDITTLRRSALCLKSGRHFAESETLDQLPLTHPEHFGNPVVGSRRGGRRRLGSDDSSGEEEAPRKGKPRDEIEAEIGKIICVELGDKKKIKDNWFPGLVVSPSAQEVVRIRVKEDYLVRSFKDARYYTVPKDEAIEFTREVGMKVENSTLKTAVEKALTFLDKDELPPHWDREQLFSQYSDVSDSDAGLDSDSSDDEPREEKDHFVAQLYKFMDDRGTPINACPSVCSKDLDLYKLFKLVRNMNGYNRVNNNNQWKTVSTKLGFAGSPGIVTQVKHAYKKFLHSFEDFNRKLGCTMVNHPRGSRSRNKGGRSLIRDVDRTATVKESTGGVKKIDEPVVEEVAKKIEEVKPKAKVDEPEAEPSSDPEPVRPGPTSRKKFPTLKASPRTKDDTPTNKRRAEKPAAAVAAAATATATATRPKRALRENSMDDGRTSGEESVKTNLGSEEQRSSSRVRSREESLKQLKKESRAGKLSSKSSDSDGSKNAKSEEAKKDEVAATAADAGLLDESGEKKNRKLRGSEKKSIPRNQLVLKGDVVNVYYGSTNENSVYEAKVVDIEEEESGDQMYLVHYSGWNSRYDEWVKKCKIAKNVSWLERKKGAAAKRELKPQTSGTVPRKKGPAAKNEPVRSTTPSSITSSSSRTKSPATPVTTRRRMARRERPTITSTRRRTRRLSGHTDMSIDSQSESDSESVESDSDSELPFEVKEKALPAKKPVKRSRPLKKTRVDSSFDPTDKKKPRLSRNTAKAGKDVDDSPASPSTSSSKNSDTAKRSDTNDLNDESMSKLEDGDSPKGRDFDLNEIRSELKGIDKAIKVANAEALAGTIEPTNADQPNESESQVVSDVDSDIADNKPLVEKKQTKENLVEDEKSANVLKQAEETAIEIKQECQPTETEVQPPVDVKFDVDDSDFKEDIYEFKEPEPFDFQEVRRPIRVFDEIFERSPEKATSVTKPITPAKTAAEKKEPSPQDDLKSRFRKTICKKIKESEKRKTTESKTEDIVEPLSEIDDNPPPTLLVEAGPQLEPGMLKSEVEDEPPPVITLMQKTSPEPPCLLPVSETPSCPPAEHSPVLIREDPPRLSTEASSSDSESEERLVIANDEESTSSDVKLEFLTATKELSPSPPPPTSPLALPLPLPPTQTLIAHEERRDTKRSPLSEIRLKRVEERLRSVLNNPIKIEDSSPAKDANPFRPIPSTSKASTADQPVQELQPMETERLETAETAAPSSSSNSGGLRSLVCDEDIPGSPAPKDPSDDFQAPVASVMENTPPTTPPTTPESNASSPREDRVGRLYQSIELSSLDNESSKSHRDSSEVDLDHDNHRNRAVKYEKRNDDELQESPSKKKRARKRSESTSEQNKRGPNRTAGASPRIKRDPHGSDSDDTSENSSGIHAIDASMSNRSPRPMKSNYWKEMAPDLDAHQKIAYLQHRLLELKQHYAVCKTELASIERKRKKVRRKEREEKQAAAQASTPIVVHPIKPQEPISQ